MKVNNFFKYPFVHMCVSFISGKDNYYIMLYIDSVVKFNCIFCGHIYCVYYLVTNKINYNG